MAKTREQREAEEKQRQEELAAFGGRSLRRSIPGETQLNTGESSTTGLLQSIQEDDEDQS